MLGTYPDVREKPASIQDFLIGITYIVRPKQDREQAKKGQKEVS
jgi:hypothetical protein